MTRSRVARSPDPPTVIKFGGSTLTTPGRVVQWIRRTRERAPRLVVVVSARAKVTDALERALDRPGDTAGHQRLLRRLRRLHRPLTPELRGELGRLRGRFRTLERGRASDPDLRPAISATGERLAAEWMAEQLRANGLPARVLHADRAGLRVRGGPAAPRVDLPGSAREFRSAARAALRGGEVAILTGYLGRGPSGAVRTLGRGGSDYTAVACAAILGARNVVLVKRDAPLRAADPALLSGAAPIPELSYARAGLLARLGARALHPPAIALARRTRIGIHITSLNDPSRATRIDPGTRDPDHPILVLLPAARAGPDPRPPAVRVAVVGGAAGRKPSELPPAVDRIRVLRGLTVLELGLDDPVQALARLHRSLVGGAYRLRQGQAYSTGPSVGRSTR